VAYNTHTHICWAPHIVVITPHSPQHMYTTLSTTHHTLHNTPHSSQHITLSSSHHTTLHRNLKPHSQSSSPEW